jgi:(2R)-3-sulfolactate dehydrogenase (NADP+)
MEISKRYQIQVLYKIVQKILFSSGLSKKDGEIVCDCLLTSDLYGVSSHGISILDGHLKRIETGGYNLKPNIKTLKKTVSISIVDADNSIGFLSAVHSMNIAISKATKSGLHTVFTRNANTFGAAFYYAEMAARKGLIGICFSNSSPAMAPWGGIDKLIGTNPFAIAIPGLGEEMILFDFASSKVAKSKIKQALDQNEKIPEDWALDVNGKQTNDPLEAIKGIVLPMSDHKGYGIALSIDILSGVLSGAAFLNNVGKFYSDERDKSMNVGQTFMAIDPKVVYGEDFYKVINQYCERIRTSKSIDGKPVRVPGDGKRTNLKKNIEFGIPLDELTVSKIMAIQKRYNMNENHL